MDLFRKAFLLFVGVLSIALEETTKSVKEANKSIEEQRGKLAKTAKPA
jgi:archaellum component FlaF (FlaF/FlaG flagellin family)